MLTKLRASTIRTRLRLIDFKAVTGCKDPSELHLADPEHFRDRFTAALAQSVPCSPAREIRRRLDAIVAAGLSPDARVAEYKALVALVGELPDPVERDAFIHMLRHAFSFVRIDTIRADVWREVMAQQQAEAVAAPAEGNGAPTPEQIAAWREQAEPLLTEASLLDRFAADIHQMGLVHEDRAAKLLYLVKLSIALLARAASAIVKGQSSGGKNFLVESVMRFFPPTSYQTVSMKTRGGPPGTAVRSAVDHRVIHPEPQDVTRRRTAQWEPTTSVWMCIAGRPCS